MTLDRQRVLPASRSARTASSPPPTASPATPRSSAPSTPATSAGATRNTTTPVLTPVYFVTLAVTSARDCRPTAPPALCYACSPTTAAPVSATTTRTQTRGTACSAGYCARSVSLLPRSAPCATPT